MNQALQATRTTAEQATAQESMDGSPAVVRDTAGYINIKFQCGPVLEVGVNGTTIEDVLQLLAVRLTGFQHGPFACAENADALNHIYSAKAALEARTLRRKSLGIEGTNAEAPAD